MSGQRQPLALPRSPGSQSERMKVRTVAPEPAFGLQNVMGTGRTPATVSPNRNLIEGCARKALCRGSSR
jgi:hypothetical protein